MYIMEGSGYIEFEEFVSAGIDKNLFDENEVVVIGIRICDILENLFE